MDVGNTKNRPSNPRAKANIFEVITYSWILKLFNIGQKRDLEVNDLYVTLSEHTSSTLGDEFEKKWTAELASKKQFNREPSLLRVLFQMFGALFVLNGAIQLFVEVVLRVSQPILIGKLLTYFDRNKSNTTDLKQAYIYASGLLLTMLFNILLFHYSQMEIIHCGMKIRVACCSAIFKKALRLSKTSLGETTVGQIMNLLSNDVNRFDVGLRFIQFIWVGPLVTIVVTYFLWQEIGVSSLVGVFVILAVIPLQGWFGKKASEFRMKTASRTDERVKLMNEIISGIQLIKMYTWEKPFASLVQYARKMEIKEIRGSSYISVIVMSFKIFHIRFALFMTILSYILLGNYINTHKVYVTISLYNILMTTMTVFFPRSIIYMAEMLVSIKRIQDFLLLDEKDRKIILLLKSENTLTNGLNMSTINGENVTTENVNNQRNEKNVEQSNEFGVVVSNATAKWAVDQPNNSLNGINLTVKPGRLVAIIGSIGAGKSSLMHAILRELPLSNGNISVKGVVSYSSQEPWLFNSSVQQNILFGSPMNDERYEQIIHVCALKSDFKQLPYGDRTIVGDRGISLSGGQRARINLARAIYKEADIYLLDDPLSAVDTHVGKHLFEKCIRGYLKEKTCILITHQLQYLTNVDQIVLMKNGTILAEGSYQKLQSSGLDFTKLLGISENTAITSVDDKSPDDNGDLGPHSVLLRQESVQSFSSTTQKSSKSGEAYVEPVEVAETSGTGRISSSVYFAYMLAGGSVIKIALLICICLVTQALCTGGDYWINYWVNLEENMFVSEQNESVKNSTSSVHNLLWWSVSRQTCVTFYTVLILAMIIVTFIRSALTVSFFMSISTNLHNNMFNALTRATMYFFNTNSSGRILNRFTKDIGIIDEIIPIPIQDFIFTLVTLVGVLFVVIIINVYLIIPTFIIGVFYYRVIVFYMPTSRNIKRLEGVLRSPIFAHLNASLQGLTTIRAFEAEDILSKEFATHQDLHSSAWFIFISSSEALGFALDIISLVYMSIVVYSFLIIDNINTFNGDVGLVITQVISLTGSLQWGTRQAAELENEITSVERILEYTNVPQEAAFESLCPNKKPPKEWPNNGQIKFQKLYLRYSLDTPYVLNNLNIIIQPMEKIGIVGRTGAGKSSLIGALFRLALNEGHIFIDGIEVHEIGLHELRSKLSIIPQEPFLFSGTMRKNLDPFDEYSDHALWKALNEVELKNVVEDLPDGLNSKMSEGGSNLSVGQRQLVCLARAIVKCNKILVLDEATANVDSQTDALIQNTIRNKFQECTVLTIAHRLNTVMDSDKVIVMDAGTMVEFDHPHCLLQNKNGFLYKMVEQTGQKTAKMLHGIAAESFETLRTNKESLIKLIDDDTEEN